ncbi:hypothetical protein [Phaeocystidibacter marisrubri]|uniref:Uncharacterized protein n=1 Tax=Phaeocystidibacter marisrubri TaxID=1577780 RepID=A0A6L3ZEI2_9FLAO|nr:hypothetical protein [Phaeocystidibacter marisrubri]KAB2816008.1 hypothetical protein F8C82_09950 [Phaeocystidibacter marisrubri]GGH66855.1 hypothetical protein GCM10011318_05240 [Phaeocystidibacter marisrubri]
MKKVFIFLGPLLFSFSIAFAGEVPDRVIYKRSGGGENGYSSVKQKWLDTTSDETVGSLKCTGEGLIRCIWQTSGVGYPIDLDTYAEEILTMYDSESDDGSGTIVVGSTTFTYQVIENLGKGDGTVIFTFL